MVMSAKKLTKIEIAAGHIHAAIELKSQIGFEPSILHLAAAADEIIEAMLKREGKRTMSQTLLAIFQEYYPGLDRKKFHQDVSRTKNAVKHADVPEEDEVEIPELQSFAALIRAIMNYETLIGDLTPKMRQFMSLCRKSNKMQSTSDP